MNDRHHLTFDIYEEGKISLDDYLNRIIFYRERPFMREEFKAYMHDQSKPFFDMIELIRFLENKYCLQVAAVSNEGRELIMYHVQQYELGIFIDFFISSCFVHYHKPDKDMYQIALDIAQVRPEQVVYVDDRAMFVEVAQEIGIRGIIHTHYQATLLTLEQFGLKLGE